MQFGEKILSKNLPMENCRRQSHNFVTFVGYSKMGIHVVLSFVFVTLKHVLLAIQVDNK